jgi:hypothetical protein
MPWDCHLGSPHALGVEAIPMVQPVCVWPKKLSANFGTKIWASGGSSTANTVVKGNQSPAPALALRTGGNLLLSVSPYRRAKWGTSFFVVEFFFWEGLSLQAKQRSAPPKKPRACLSQAPTKRGVCASLPAALLWRFLIPRS